MNIRPAICALLLGIPLLAGGQTVHATDDGMHAAEEGRAAGSPLAIENFSATFTFTTDYVFRGISFSNQAPAPQGSLDWTYNNFYAGVWGTRIDDFDLEFDYYAGYFNSLGPIDFDLMLIYFHFPFDDSVFAPAGLEANMFETWLTLSHTFEQMPGTPTLHAMYAFSPDFSGEDGFGHYVEAGLGFNLPYGFGLDGYWGYQYVEGDKASGPGGAFFDPAFLGSSGGYDYHHWSVGLTNNVLGFDLDLRYHDTNRPTDAVFWFTKPLMKERIVFMISRTF